MRTYEVFEAQDDGRLDRGTSYELWRCEDGERVELLGSDGGEPEDQLLVRDWDWVAPALMKAYQEGLRDGALESFPDRPRRPVTTAEPCFRCRWPGRLTAQEYPARRRYHCAHCGTSYVVDKEEAPK